MKTAKLSYLYQQGWYVKDGEDIVGYDPYDRWKAVKQAESKGYEVTYQDQPVRSAEFF